MRVTISQITRAATTYLATLIFATSADAQTDATLPAIGGTGGSQFIARCAPDQLLNGFDLTIGDDIDAIRPICVIAATPSQAGTGQLYPVTFGTTRLPGSLEEQLLGPLATLRLACPQESPIVIGLYVGWEGQNTVTVNNIHLYCGLARLAQFRNEYPTVVFDGKTGSYPGNARQDCPFGLVAVGITGRAGKWLDAVGLICGPPKVTGVVGSPSLFEALKSTSAPEAVRPQGRIRGTDVELRPSPPICEAAKAARARNSPAAPGLEAKCVAEGSVKPTSRVKGTDGTTSVSTLTKCEAAKGARARNSPAAPGLEKQCAAERAMAGTSVAEAGEPIAASRLQHTIAVLVRYRRELGYKGSSGPFGNFGRSSCGAFTVSATPSDDLPQQTNPVAVNSDLRMEDAGNYYECNYLVSEIPFDQAFNVRVGVADADLYAPWEGSGYARPPLGQRRSIVDATRTSTLTTSQPRARLTYEMVYAPIGER